MVVSAGTGSVSTRSFSSSDVCSGGVTGGGRSAVWCPWGPSAPRTGDSGHSPSPSERGPRAVHHGSHGTGSLYEGPHRSTRSAGTVRASFFSVGEGGPEARFSGVAPGSSCRPSVSDPSRGRGGANLCRAGPDGPPTTTGVAERRGTSGRRATSCCHSPWESGRAPSAASCSESRVGSYSWVL